MEELDKQDALRIIPPVNEIIESQEALMLIDIFGRDLVLDNVRQIVTEYREGIGKKDWIPEECSLRSRQGITEYIIKKLKDRMDKHQKSGLKKVINATGIVLHTNLGRAPLPEKALELMTEIGEGYSNLEFDLESGARGSRHSHIDALISRITGAESVIVVNNNAAAVFLCLNTLANGKEVIISRGQQVEIGGSFRIPDIIVRSGAKMAEVGTTNKTRISDYLQAVNGETAVLLKVHTSNYKVIGFTEEVPLEQLINMGKETELVVMEDLGSGSLFDLTKIGLPYEPLVQDSIKAGADLVTFSGDKLLGGPQAGIIAGKKDFIDKIKKNPLTRMVRCDKTAIAALAAVLSLYIDMDNIVENVPALKMLAMTEEELLMNAQELQGALDDSLGNKCTTEIVDDQDEVGGGSLPGVILKGKAVAVNVRGIEVNKLQARLRQGRNPIVCRINKDRLLLNVRTLSRKDYPVIVESLAGILE